MGFYYTFQFYLAILALTTISFLYSSKAANPITLPIIKDSTKPQYYTTFLLGTPPISVTLAIDLSSPWSWFTCNLVGFNDTSYSGIPNSSTYRVLRCIDDKSCGVYDSFSCYTCDFPQCKPRGKMCVGEIYPPNLYFGGNLFGGHSLAPLLLDIITVYKSNGPSPLKKRVYGFPFGCTGIDDLKGLSHYTKGVLGLGRKGTSLHSLIAKVFKVPHKFALCLPSSSSSTINGAMYFGGGPYKFPPNTLDLSRNFVTTALVTNPIDVGLTYEKRNSSIEYYVNIKSILVEGTPLKINSSLLVIDKKGLGGTKINTIYPYTTLHTNIYNALVEAFTSKAASMNITRVAQVSSFRTCFSSKNIVGTKIGPKVPTIDFMLEGNNKNPLWRIYGSNSMIKVSNDVRCLAFVDGGVTGTAAIVIGGKQMEDNLVEFDLESNKFGVTSSLLRFGTSCSQFRGA